MNNNRNNRRRGRGNNRSQGGNQVNRIDSRARGNAPQLLEKYRKLAHDASLNGDRVQAEYYLQFADHYFRVIADGRARQEEQRARREEERFPPGDPQSDEYDDDGSYDSPPPRGRGRAEPRETARETGPAGEDAEDVEQAEDGVSGVSYEPADNPFIRRNTRTRTNTRRRQPAEEAAEEGESGDQPTLALDPSSLPPPIGASDSEAEEKPAPRKRAPRRPRAAPVENDGEPLEKAG
ncbi:MAG: DUF4167 domain-containing protein [Novosphingobium sp.]